MKPMSQNEKERINRMNEAALYDIGYYCSEQICSEMDMLLEEYKELELPKDLDNWFGELKQKKMKAMKTTERLKKYRVYGKRAAIIFVILMISIGTVTVSVEAYRMQFFNFIVQTKEKFSSINIEEDVSKEKISYSDIPARWESYYYPTYIPGEYILDKASGEKDYKRMLFVDSNNNQITFMQIKMSSNIQLDTEHAGARELEINGKKGVFVEEEGYITITWYNQEYVFTLDGKVDENVLLQIAESVIKNN